VAMPSQKIHVPVRKRAFYLAASHRQIKKSLLCVLGASAVRFLFGSAAPQRLLDLNGGLNANLPRMKWFHDRKERSIINKQSSFINHQ
jgi:hypothetical protein